MSDTDQTDQKPDAARPSEIEIVADETIGDGKPGTASGATVDAFDVLRDELRAIKERAARAQADFDNARKRLRKEADESGTRAVIRFVRPILDQLDNFGRALNAAKPEAFAEFAQGVSMIHANLASALAQSGIEPVPAEGVFDPAVHEVIAEVERGDVPKGTIVEVFRPGYRLKDQLVRAAQVVVAKPPA
ncbi:MAG TPA: nucleotide exchange factor GrpE [Planctomycetota bacterium]|nr:nucleotide exchange factor GrpE [Planctomycetota bacterium]